MRSLLLFFEMLALLPIALVHPFVGVLIWDWISFMNPQQISWGIGSKLPWAVIAFVFTVVGWMVSPIEPKKITVTPLIVLMVLFVVGITMNLPFALSPVAVEYDAWLRTTKIFIFLIITAALLTDRHRIDALIWMIVISIGYYILDQGGASVVTLGGHKAFGPTKSQIADNNAFAAAVLILIPLMNYLRLQSRHALIRFGFVLAMALSTLTVLASYSRGALLGLFAVAFVFWLKSKRKIASLFAVSVVLGSGLALMPEKWWERMNKLQNIHEDKSAEGRLYIWRVAWNLFKKQPFTGVGFHATDYHNVIDLIVPGGNVHEIHSIWFQMLAEQGIFVFLIWLGMIVYGFIECRRLAKVARARPEFSWAADLARMGQISILAYVVTGTFLPISSWDVFFTTLVAFSAAHAIVANEIAGQRRAAERTPRPRPMRPIPAMGRAPQGLGGAS